MGSGLLDAWPQLVASNLVLAGGLALVALGVQRVGRWPGLAHLLWVGVLLKLVTPTLLPVEVAGAPTPARPAEQVMARLEPQPRAELVQLPAMPKRAQADGPGLAGLVPPSEPTARETRLAPRTVLGWTWVIGSVAALLASLGPLLAFRRSLRRASRPAAPELQAVCDELSSSFGLRRAPQVLTAQAQLSPFLWWLGGRPQVVLPESLTASLSPSALRLVLAHELAHLRRRDHWVRAVEWLATVACWWNPLTRLARRQLRQAEELACDALVLQALQPNPKSYADALLCVAESLVSPALRPPALACPLTSGGSLEARLTMILTHKLPSPPRWLRVAALALTLGLLPIGLAGAQDFEKVGARLRAAVAAGELTGEQARLMMDALRRSVEAPRRDTGQREGDTRAAQRARYEEVAKRLEDMVASGEVSRADADKRLAQMRERLAVATSGEKTHADIQARYNEILEAVQAGKLSRDDARLKMEALRAEWDQLKGAQDSGQDQVEARLDRNHKAMREILVQIQDVEQILINSKLTPEETKRLHAHLARLRQTLKDMEAAEAQMHQRARAAELDAALNEVGAQVRRLETALHQRGLDEATQKAMKAELNALVAKWKELEAAKKALGEGSEKAATGQRRAELEKTLAEVGTQIRDVEVALATPGLDEGKARRLKAHLATLQAKYRELEIALKGKREGGR